MFAKRLGKYYPVDSKIHALNPVMKLLSFFLMVIMICLTKDVVIEFILFCFLFLLILLSHVELSFFLKPVWKMKFLFLGILLLEILCKDSKEQILLFFLRLINLIFASSILVYTTKNKSFVYGLEVLLKPLILLGLPIRSMIMMVSLAIQFIPNLFLELEKILKSLACRGMDYHYSNRKEKWEIIKATVNPMLLYTFKKADFISDSMELQGYEVEKKRTSYMKYEMKLFDYIFLFFHVSVFLLIFIKGVL